MNGVVLAEWSLHRDKDFSTSLTALPTRSCKSTGSWWCTDPGQLMQTNQRDNSIWHHMMFGKEAGQKGRRGRCWEWLHLSSQETTSCDDPDFPGSNWTSACLLMGDSKWIFFLLCLCMKLLVNLLKCLYFKPQFFWLLLFWFSPLSHLGRVSDHLCGADLLARDKPQHKFRMGEST